MTDSVLRPIGERFTFDTPFDQYAARRGQMAVVVAHYTEDDADHDISEVGPMYRVQFDDGAEIEAWPEEVEYTAAGESWRHMARGDNR